KRAGSGLESPRRDGPARTVLLRAALGPRRQPGQRATRLRRDGSAHRVTGARQRSDGVEKYSSIASRQAPEHGFTVSSSTPDSRISAATFSAQLMQTPARSIPQPVQSQLDL